MYLCKNRNIALLLEKESEELQRAKLGRGKTYSRLELESTNYKKGMQLKLEKKFSN